MKVCSPHYCETKLIGYKAMKTYEEYIEEMRDVIPACDWNQEEVDDTWDQMCRYEMYDTCSDDEEELDCDGGPEYEPSEALSALSELKAIMNK